VVKGRPRVAHRLLDLLAENLHPTLTAARNRAYKSCRHHDGSSVFKTTMNAINTLTPQQLRQAADLQEQILGFRNELDQILGSSSPDQVDAPAGKRKLSAQGLANIRAGARRRWAKRAGNGAESSAPRRRRKMSAAGRASIAAKMKARWRAAKRAGRKAL
jgi:hypothetical protein